MSEQPKFTPGPWRCGYWYGICLIPSHVEAKSHPRPSVCKYEPQFAPMDEYGYVGIASAEPGVNVVSTEYDELRIKREDAHLIAAAPDLYEALKAILDVLKKEAVGTPLNSHRYDDIGIQAHNAIAKAEGRR